MANDLGGMPFSPEVNAFEAEIGSNQRLVTSGDLEDGTVIADTGDNPLLSGRATPDSRNQKFFC
jgi:hypothetical protein